MLDLVWDFVAQDCIMVNGDFSTTPNPSAQNGAILLIARGTNLSEPIMGIGIEEVYNSDQTELAYEMNRWRSQVLSDGGRARWTPTQTDAGVVNKWEANYQ